MRDFSNAKVGTKVTVVYPTGLRHEGTITKVFRTGVEVDGGYFYDKRNGERLGHVQPLSVERIEGEQK